MPFPHSKNPRPLLRSALTAALLCALPLLFESNSRARSAGPHHTIVLGAANRDSLYAITIALKDPAQLQPQATFQISIADSKGIIDEIKKQVSANSGAKSVQTKK